MPWRCGSFDEQGTARRHSTPGACEVGRYISLHSNSELFARAGRLDPPSFMFAPGLERPGISGPCQWRAKMFQVRRDGAAFVSP